MGKACLYTQSSSHRIYDFQHSPVRNAYAKRQEGPIFKPNAFRHRFPNTISVNSISIRSIAISLETSNFKSVNQYRLLLHNSPSPCLVKRTGVRYISPNRRHHKVTAAYHARRCPCKTRSRCKDPCYGIRRLRGSLLTARSLEVLH